MPGDSPASQPRTPPPSMAGFPRAEAIPGAYWNEEFGLFGYGSCNCVCVTAWVFLLLLPSIFFMLVAPGLEAEHGDVLVKIGLALFGCVVLFFCLVSTTNPGVAPMPPPNVIAGREIGLAHPGEQYSYCQDSNRYVRGFDHFCDFVGNDIGDGNMPFFVAFLLSLSAFASFLVGCCMLEVYDMSAPPGPSLHLEHNVLKELLACALLALVLACLRGCARSDACDGLLPLILMMPGATFGAWLLIAVLALLVVAPLVTDMWASVTPEHNPAAFYLILPYLAFGVLFFGMAAHWLSLLCQGLSQKVWLRSRGYRRHKPQRESASNAELV
mmetsp:Transcript_22246/g.71897  ORF Transcript_22246/g.71897 Transcript_22246/m.71897 type:complete len:327 (-) Transcript_22246:380-1360(-)